jgi:hypothetical protein
MKVQVTVTLELPEDAERVDAVYYVLDAVRSMAGCLDPDTNPFAYLDPTKVEVK